MKKRIKVFESGKYPQSDEEYTKERVKKIFDTGREVNAIFQHTSKWKKEGKEPVSVGKFNNFEIKDVDGKSVVYADLNFNEKGERYYNDQILKGVSAEIPSDYLTKIAVLPIGINPQIQGAEFEESIFFEFEEIEEKKGNDMTREDVLKSLTKEEILAYGKVEGLEIKEVVPEKQKTEEEIRSEIKEEYNRKAKAETKANEFMEVNKLKITPAMKEIGLDKEFMTELYMSGSEFEFNKEKANIGEILEKIFEKMPKALNLNNVSSEAEFKNESIENVTEIMKKAKEETEKMYK